MGARLSPRGVHLPRRRVALANDSSKEIRNGQSAGQSRDVPLDAESHGQHRRGQAPEPPCHCRRVETWDCILHLSGQEAFREQDTARRSGLGSVLRRRAWPQRAWRPSSDLQHTCWLLTNNSYLSLISHHSGVVTGPLETWGRVT